MGENSASDNIPHYVRPLYRIGLHVRSEWMRLVDATSMNIVRRRLSYKKSLKLCRQMKLRYSLEKHIDASWIIRRLGAPQE